MNLLASWHRPETDLTVATTLNKRTNACAACCRVKVFALQSITLQVLLWFLNTAKMLAKHADLWVGWNVQIWNSICGSHCRKYDSNALILQTSAIIMNFFFVLLFILGYSKHVISLNFFIPLSKYID